MINVMIADDHEILRKGLVSIVSETDDICVMAEASNGEEVLQKLKQGHYDVLILDISMPKGNGFEVINTIRKNNRKLPILILSMHSEDQYALRMIKSGANGYMTKESAPNELIEAIRTLAKGGRYISEDLVDKMAFALDVHTHEEAHNILSNREYQVLLLIAEGNTINEISEKLNLSPKTISTYKRRILEKMDMNNTTELIRYVIEKNLFR
jgi:DNA-binding NarL/FixJ family response regulator